MQLLRWSVSLVLLGLPSSIAAANLQAEAEAALRKAVGFYRSEVATDGGYLWLYSADLKLREGEGKVEDATVWVQPPGTPAVGMAFLAAYQRVGEAYLLEAARAAADALVRGQLQSGGWTGWIHFDAGQRQKFAYRVAPAGRPGRARNVSTLDDNKTQSALRLLMRVDRALHFEDRRIHEAARFALDSLLKVQYASGAWPQGWDHSVDPRSYPPVKAEFPESWSRTYEGHQNYWFRPTFNDGAIMDAIEVMIEAADIYGDARYREAALRGGEFILLAQMPEPQPAWAQQYNDRMEPCWARKFEPPAISAGESQRILRTLMLLYRRTGDRKWLEPIPRALAWFKRSTLPDGRLARFYELKTNKPLYFTKNYVLTYDDSDVPAHYAFKVSSEIAAIEREYADLVNTPRETSEQQNHAAPPGSSAAIEEQAQEIQRVIKAMDHRGAWVERGRMKHHPYEGEIISSSTFIRNVELLSIYLQAAK